MRSDEKVLISIYASTETEENRENKIRYQLYHTLIFYLAKVEHFEFPGYSFSPFLWGKLGNALISRQLSRDTGLLCASGYLTLNSPMISITELGTQVTRDKVKAFEDKGRKYANLKAAVDKALRSAHESEANFLRLCYRAYLEDYASFGIHGDKVRYA